MVATEKMSSDSLTRFLLPDAHTRGAMIRGKHIIAEAARIHGLNGPASMLFGQTLLSSILLLSISKGGMRQVLQLDATNQAPVQRVLAEAGPGAVRGFLNWQEEEPILRFERDDHLASWMGTPIQLSTVRDLGIGQPYISTIEHNSDFLADHLIHYLNQSVQIRADIILMDDFAMMIEAMPDCDEEHWFSAVEAMAKIPDAVIKSGDDDSILSYFSGLRCKIAGNDEYRYLCSCSKEKMTTALSSIPANQLKELADEQGKVQLSCQYCDQLYLISPEDDSSSEH